MERLSLKQGVGFTHPTRRGEANIGKSWGQGGTSDELKYRLGEKEKSAFDFCESVGLGYAAFRNERLMRRSPTNG